MVNMKWISSSESVYIQNPIGRGGIKFELMFGHITKSMRNIEQDLVFNGSELEAIGRTNQLTFFFRDKFKCVRVNLDVMKNTTLIDDTFMASIPYLDISFNVTKSEVESYYAAAHPVDKFPVGLNLG